MNFVGNAGIPTKSSTKFSTKAFGGFHLLCMTGANEEHPAVTVPPAVGQPQAAPRRTSAGQLKEFLAELDAVALGLRQRAGDGESGPGESKVLQLLTEHRSLTVPQLARLRGTSRQNIQIVVDRLAAEGCLSLDGNPAHKRSALVHLTEKGRQRLRTAQEQEAAFQAALAARLAALDLSQGLELLRLVREVLNSRHSLPRQLSPGAMPRPTDEPRRKRTLVAAEFENDSSDGSPGLSEEPTDYGLPANLL
jgi:DNA-binding MarR family transcriptional regulator